MRTIEELKTEIANLSEAEQHLELDKLAWVWEMDWDFLKVIYWEQNLSDEEVKQKKREYYDNCRKIFSENFGYVPFPFDDYKLTHLKCTWRLNDLP